MRISAQQALHRQPAAAVVVPVVQVVDAVRLALPEQLPGLAVEVLAQLQEQHPERREHRQPERAAVAEEAVVAVSVIPIPLAIPALTS